MKDGQSMVDIVVTFFIYFFTCKHHHQYSLGNPTNRSDFDFNHISLEKQEK